MADRQDETANQPSRFTLSLDWWSVIVALVLVLLVWLGAIPNVAW